MTLAELTLIALQLAAIAPLLPLLAAAGLLMQMLRRRRQALAVTASFDDADRAEDPTARLSLLVGWLTLALLAAGALATMMDGVPTRLTFATWLALGKGRQLAPTLTVDGRHLLFALLAQYIGLVMLRFSRTYLHREPGFHRFYLGMNLLLAGMLCIALAGDLLVTFVGWELCGISSFLLIAYAWQRPTVTANALYALISNRIGDAGLLLALCLATVWLGAIDFAGLAAGNDRLMQRLVALGLVTAALAKSGQWPFAGWLPRALEGPTPSSALFYGAVMVHAGVFLLLQATPLLGLLPDVMILLAVLGAATAITAWLTGLTRSDVKSQLLFSVQSQIGLMFLAIGLGFYELAYAHMLLHMAYRAWQFLLSPSWLVLTSGALPAPCWLDRWPRLRVAAHNGFWLDALARALLVRPVERLSGDLRRLENEVLAPASGSPDCACHDDRPVAATPVDGTTTGPANALFHPGPCEPFASPGLVGRLLLIFSDFLQRIETRLILRGGDGPARRLLTFLGHRLRTLEALLEEPRYLVVLIAITFAVIL